jgi:hypothetical protein
VPAFVPPELGAPPLDAPLLPPELDLAPPLDAPPLAGEPPFDDPPVPVPPSPPDADVVPPVVFDAEGEPPLESTEPSWLALPVSLVEHAGIASADSMAIRSERSVFPAFMSTPPG